MKRKRFMKRKWYAAAVLIGLLTAALAAEGESRIHGLSHIDRGYERLERSLQSLGADISRI